MNKLKNYLKNQKGATIIETLVALGFIGVVSTGFLMMAIEARKISFRNKAQYELGRYAGIIAEEVVKDYTINNSITSPTKYCQSGTNDVGNLVSKYLNDFSSGTCTVSGSAGTYYVDLSVVAFGVTLTSRREIILK